MRKIAAWSLVTCSLLALALPAFAGEKVTKTGEVIDSACYISKGAKGEGHRGCAQKCADKGIPLALLEDGTDQVIWLLSADHSSANAQLKPYADQKVKITGEMSERAGEKLLVIDKIEPAS